MLVLQREKKLELNHDQISRVESENKEISHADVKPTQPSSKHKVETKVQSKTSILSSKITEKINSLPENVKSWLETKNPPAWSALTLPKSSTLLVYIHVPKTAGSSFRGLINQFLPVYKHWYPDTGTKSFVAKYCGTNRDTNICTHGSLSEITNCLDNNPDPNLEPFRLTNRKFISVVREPVSRVISEFYYWRNKSAPAWPDVLRTETNRNDLKKWVKTDPNSAYNRQAKSMVYYQDLIPPFENGTWGECHNLNGRRDLQYWTQKSGGYDSINLSDDLLNNLIATIENKFAFIGITGLMFDSVEIASKIIGAENNFDRQKFGYKSVRKSHASHKPDKIRQDLENYITQKSQLDLKLYAYVLKKLLATVQEINL